MNATCPVCIRACPVGRSFCGRRDAAGRLIAPDSYQAALADFLFDKPLLHYRGNLRVLSVGSWGCNLRCRGCQNARLSWTSDGAGLRSIELGTEALVGRALERDCQGICFTFNEPAILIEMVEAVAGAARAAGLATVLVTNSTLTRSSVRRVGPLLDAVAADIKSLDDRFYERYCGAAGIPGVAGKILDCIRAFREAGCHLEVRTNVIPGGNDQEGNFAAIAGWIKDELGENTPWHVTRFFPAHELGGVPRTPEATLLRAREIGLGAGLKRVHAHPGKGCDCAGEEALDGIAGLEQAQEPRCCCGEGERN